MKAILLSIKSEWVAKILNGEKTIEVRKLFPKDYVGWVFMYCSKDKKFPLVLSSDGESFQEYCNAKCYPPFIRGDVLNGKVVARFWCDKVEEIYFEREVIGEICDMPMFPRTNTLTTQELIEKSGTKYLPYGETEIGNYLDDKGYAIHISKLEIFDKPRELGEFKRYIDKWDYYSALGKYTLSQPKEKLVVDIKKEFDASLSLTKAPQNYCYVEGE